MEISLPPAPIHANIPAELRGGHWAVSTLEPNERREGKLDKSPRHPGLVYPNTSYPYHVDTPLPNGGINDHGQPSPPWASFDECLAAVLAPAHRAKAMGRLLQGDFVCLDLDNVTPEAQEWVGTTLRPTWTEWSQSRRGLHLFWRGEFLHTVTGTGLGFKAELYGADSYIVCTGYSYWAPPQPIRSVTPEELAHLADMIDPAWRGRAPTGWMAFGEAPGRPDPATTVEMLVAAYAARKRYTGEYGRGDKTGSGQAWGIAKDLIRDRWPSWEVFHAAWFRCGIDIGGRDDRWLHRTYCKAWAAVVEELRKQAEPPEWITNSLNPIQRQRSLRRQEELRALIALRGSAPDGSQ